MRSSSSVGSTSRSKRPTRPSSLSGSPLGAWEPPWACSVLRDLAPIAAWPTKRSHSIRVPPPPARPGASRLRWPPEVFLAMTLHQLDAFEDAHGGIARGAACRRAARQRLLSARLRLRACLAQLQRRPLGGGHRGTTLAELSSWPTRSGSRCSSPWPSSRTACADLRPSRRAARSGRLTRRARKPRRRGDGGGTGTCATRRSAGGTDGALATLKRAWEHDGPGIVYRRRVIGLDLVRLSLAAGDRELANRVATGVEEATAFASFSSLDGVALRCRGLVERDVELLLRSARGTTGTARVRTCGRLRGRRRRPCAIRAEFRCRVFIRGRAARVLRGECKAGRRSSARHDAPRRPRPQAPGAKKRPERGWESLTPSSSGRAPRRERLTYPQIGQHLFICRARRRPTWRMPSATSPLLSSRACRRSGQARRCVMCGRRIPPAPGNGGASTRRIVPTFLLRRRLSPWLAGAVRDLDWRDRWPVPRDTDGLRSLSSLDDRLGRPA